MSENEPSAFVDGAATRFKESMVGTGDGIVRYFEAGEGPDPLLILYTGEIWRGPAAYELLANTRRVIRIVVPGFVHDYGEIADEVNSFPDVLEALGRIIDNLGSSVAT